MNSKVLLKIKTKLKETLKNPDIIDIIVFGSTVKGKINPKDTDIAIITEKKLNINIENFHISIINPRELLVNPISLSTTLLREGFSIKNNKPLAEALGFKSKMLYTYKLNNLNASKKVSTVRFLRGDKNNSGLIKKYKGEWLSNQVFTLPIESDSTIEQYFIYNSINYTKTSILIH
jgi:predicted nucleotidyltransferase